MSALPCVGRAPLYDVALYDEDVPDSQRSTALHQAAALCSTCPAPCPDKVTVDTERRPLVLLDPDWLPPSREGIPDPVKPAPKRRQRVHIPGLGADYVRTDQRVTAWSRMAAELADQGRTVAQIAEALCVDELTVADLLTIAHTRRAAA